MATALAYAYSGTTPSLELLEAAEAGELDDPERRVSYARDLLDSADGRALMSEFFRDWLKFDSAVTKIKTTIPEFESVRDRMVQETRDYINELVFERDGSGKQLLTANFTVVDGELASYYGFSDNPGAASAVVERDYGLGILAQGSLLAGRAHSDYTSPTQRGLPVFERFPCGDRPTMPGGVPEIPPPDPGVTTTRQRYEDLHALGACKGCHLAFDPIGFAFEHLDEGGRYRATELGLEIDASGSATRGNSQIVFDGQEELAEAFADSPEVLACVSGHMAKHVFGGVSNCLSSADSRAAVADGNLSIKEYFAQMAAAPHFERRKK